MFPQVQDDQPHPAQALPLFLKECRMTKGRCKSATLAEATSYKLQYNANAARLGFTSQWHAHTFTCYKKCKPSVLKRVNAEVAAANAAESNAQKPANEMRCRFHFPRAIVLNTRVKYAYSMIEETWSPTIELKRLDERYNGTCTNLLVGTQSNSDISLFFTAKQVLKATIYHTSYSTKSQPISEHLSTKLSVALQRLNAEKEAQPLKFDTPSEHCRRFLCRVLTGCEGLQERGALEAASLLMGFPEGYCSHQFVNLFFNNILYLLEKLAGSPDERRETFAATHHEGSNNMD